MPTWLPSALVLLSATVAVILAIAWWNTRKNRYAIGAGVAVAVAVLVWFLSGFFFTDQKEIINAVEQMRAAVQRHDTEGVFKFIAADFTKGGRDRKAFRAAADRVLSSGMVTDVNVYGYTDFKIDRARRTATLEFQAVPKRDNDNLGPRRVEATFVLESDNQWRLKSFDSYLANSTTPEDVP
jgi:hypothetical protein